MPGVKVDAERMKADGGRSIGSPEFQKR
jgi:hypothetical protein